MSNTLLNPSRIDVADTCSPFLYDIDGDSDLDLIVGQGDGTIKLYLNDGFPDVVAWREDTTYFASFQFSHSVVPTSGDIDNDDSLELVVSFKNADFPIDSMRVFRNRGGFDAPDWQELSGYMTDHARIEMPVCDQRFVDWDSDGNLDLIVLSNGEYSYVFYSNTGTPDNPYWSFDIGKTSALQLHITPCGYGGIDIADFNTDGNNDLAITYIICDGPYYVGVLLNQGTNGVPLFGLYPDFEFMSGTSSNSSVSIGDLDNDGDYDLICGGDSPVISFCRNEGNPTTPNFDPSSIVKLGPQYFESSRDFTFFNKDNDGDLDLALHFTYAVYDPMGGHFDIYVDWSGYENTGGNDSPSFSRSSWLQNIFMPVVQTGMTSGDLNGDQLPDIAYSHSNRLGLRVNNPSGEFGDIASCFASLNDSARFRYPELVDLNDDGRLDLIVYNNSLHQLAIFGNTGTTQIPAWTERPDWLNWLELGSNFVNAADLNRDSLPDLVLLVNGHLNAYLNVGSPDNPSFLFEPTALTDLQDLTVQYFELADLDGDGSEDIIINVNGKFVFIDNQTIVGVANEIVPPQNPSQVFNYPNPFGTGTSIRLNLDVSSYVGVAIYDICGRLVRNIEPRIYAVGYNDIRWDSHDDKGLNLPSGIYFYRFIINGEYGETHKLTILR